MRCSAQLGRSITPCVHAKVFAGTNGASPVCRRGARGITRWTSAALRSIDPSCRAFLRGRRYYPFAPRFIGLPAAEVLRLGVPILPRYLQRKSPCSSTLSLPSQDPAAFYRHEGELGK